MNRGQAHTLEALAAGILLLGSIVFALQITAVTPLTGSTSSQHIENQQAALGEGLLTSEAENGTLRPTLLYWNESESNYYGASDIGYTMGGPPTPFGHVLNESFRDQGIAFNLYVSHIRKNGDQVTKPIVYMGHPSDHATVATHTLAMYDDAHLRNETLATQNKTVSEVEFYVRDVAPDSHLYNVLEVKLIAWRM